MTNEVPGLRSSRPPLRGRKGLVAAVLTLAFAVPGTAAATRADSTAPVPNWAGYVLEGQATAFTSVTATWRQPVAQCTASNPGAAVAFWVGLGGVKPDSAGLEQVGTSSHCTATGATYGAWYEILPAQPVDLNLAVRPNDVITASVNVLDAGSSVLFQLKNRTLRKTVSTQVPLTGAPDLSSADWVVEAPTRCAGVLCLPVPLQQFAPVSFSRIAALGNGSGGTLTRPDWSASSLQLVPSTVLIPRSSEIPPVAAAAGALPASLTPGGTSFRVYWLPNP